MTIAAGSKLGPYEILAPIGAGGMGEVYRAKDPRLGREVAIKVLPATFSADADRLRRFEQEARAAGILNHPNITAVLDIGEHEGAPYVVQELLEGDTLRQLLAAGKLSPRRAIDFSIQIAHGLAAAHEKGIVHRDLKPENVFVTKDGRVKILDFGLAKLTGPRSEDGSLTDLPTATAGTEPGVVLGTLGYMSPEQVRGKPADSRSDIFSFGAILYEMLSGRRAFHGETAADTMSAILTKEPPDLSETNRNIAPGVERIVRHCLEKNPEERFHSAHDLAFDLQALSAGSLTGAREAALGAAAKSRRRIALPTAVALAAAALVAGALAGRLLLRGSAEPPRFTRLSFRRGLVQSARFAPDGDTIVYGAAWEGGPFETFTTRSEARDSRALGIAPSDVLSVSRTGELAVSLGRRFTIGWENAGTLARLPLDGGAPREVLENVQEADWSPDGKDLLVVREVGGHRRIEFPLGKTLYETSGWISLARIAPAGDRIAFVDHPQRGDNVGSLCVLDRGGRKSVLLQKRTVQGLAWSPDGSEIWATAGGNLIAVSGAEKTRLLARVPGTNWLLDVSKAGRVLLAHTAIRREIVGLAPGETRERNLSWFDWSYPADLSADGRTVLFDEANRSSETGYEIYARKTGGEPAVLLGEGSAIALSPDGRWAISILHPFGQTQLTMLPTGAGQPRVLTQDGIRYTNQAAGWLPDGRTVIVAGAEAGHASRIYVRNVEGGAARPITPEGIRIAFNGIAVSPDGKFVAAIDPQSRPVLYPVAGGPPRPVAGVEPGELPVRFDSTGALFVVSPVGVLPAQVTRVDVASGRREAWKQLTPLDPAGVFSIDPVRLSADGKSYVYSYRRLLSELFLVDGLR